ncbi:winged helix-turn-helix transcriptional regulator [Micromonospora sp. NPDC002575]|uniref:winged helix-turn-helix transcriptional regulator n=1 Tax=Micromonospora sp. NPDC002575 TaxID=3364222 RepID=UPI0036A7C5AE
MWRPWSSHPVSDLLQTIRSTPSGKSLNEALRRLQNRDLIVRSSSDEGLLYQLTPTGRQLLPLLLGFMQEIQQWAERYRDSAAPMTGTRPTRRP